MSVGKQLKVAGLGNDRRVRPASIRLTAARAVFDQAPSHELEAAGRFLGTDSDDAMARALHLPM